MGMHSLALQPYFSSGFSFLSYRKEKERLNLTKQMEVDKKGGYSHCAAHGSVALRNEKTWNVLLANETGYHRG